MASIWKEPLLHFLAAGAALFLLFEFAGDPDEAVDERVITVDRDALLTFIQFRTRAFEPDIAAQRLAGLSGIELERLIDDYVREEALYREALALGMDRNDYVIKRRMVQSVEFITDGFVAAAAEVTDDDVRAHYETNRDDYYVDPLVTFTHVFFASNRHGEADALKLARDKLVELNRDEVPFTAAPQHGERFPFLVNYVERTPGYVASHFGEKTAESIFALEPDESVWAGPFESAYGAHLVLLTRRTEGRYPAFDEVDDTVRQDAERAARDEAREAAIRTIVDGYEIRRSYEPAPAASQ